VGMTAMRLGPNGRRLIKSFERCSLKAYPDPGTGGEPWTIGWGHTSAAGLPSVKPWMTITQEEADQIFEHDIAPIEARVNRLVNVDLTQDQFDALVSFDFNTGALARIVGPLNKGDYASIPKQMARYTHAGGKQLAGLVRRRHAEIELWGSHDTLEGASAATKVDEPKPTKKLHQSREAMGGGAVAGLGLLDMATQANDAIDIANRSHDSLDTLLTLLQDPRFILVGVVVLLGVGIWFWRKDRLERFGV
jgi:lysozyme